MKKVLIINGPNLNLLGVREKSVYGETSFDDYFNTLKVKYNSVLELFYYHSNVEGEIINKLHEVGFDYDAILMNAGGYTHTSVAIADAVAAISSPVIEVHISNVYSREDFRHVSLMGRNCIGSVSGFGLNSYNIALESVLIDKD